LVANGGAEVGVTVNGIPAQVVGNTFFVNNLSLTEGENTITAVATDPNGASVQDSLTVTSNSTGKEWLELLLNPESGIADPAVIPAKPFAATLKVTTHLTNSLLDWSWGYQYSYTGNGTNPNPLTVVDNTGDGLEIQLSFSDPGVYRFTYSLQDTGVANGKTYTQEFMVNVLDKSELDSVLKQQWGGMKSALSARNIPKAVGYFVESSQGLYTDIFTELKDSLPAIVAGMETDIKLISVIDNTAKYRITRNEVHAGQTYPISYYIYFVVDERGRWKLYKF